MTLITITLDATSAALLARARTSLYIDKSGDKPVVKMSPADWNALVIDLEKTHEIGQTVYDPYHLNLVLRETSNGN